MAVFFICTHIEQQIFDAVPGSVPEALLLFEEGVRPCIRGAAVPRQLARVPRRHHVPCVRHAVQGHADRGSAARARRQQTAAKSPVCGRCGDNEHHPVCDTPAAQPEPQCALSNKGAGDDRLGLITKSTTGTRRSTVGRALPPGARTVAPHVVVDCLDSTVAPSRFCCVDGVREMVRMWRRVLRRVWQSMSAVAARWPHDPVSRPRLGWAAVRTFRIVCVRTISCPFQWYAVCAPRSSHPRDNILPGPTLWCVFGSGLLVTRRKGMRQ